MKKQLPFYLSLFSIIILAYSCNPVNKQQLSVDAALEHAEIKLTELAQLAESQKRIPRSSDKEGNIRWLGENYDWTEGFFPGSLWLMYEETGDESWKNRAASFQQFYESHKFHRNDHDLGFIFNCSFGNGYKLTEEEHYKQVMIEAAKTLMTCYHEEVGAIRSWDVTQEWVREVGWQYPVIIDNMMNLELLFKATEFTNDSSYWNIAKTHANTTIANHFREDNSSYHVLDYDSLSGAVRKKQTNQGYADESAWARGQAWGLYGFTMAFRYTKDTAYLNQAISIARFLMHHPNTPEDKICYWDYDAPNIPDAKRDASAAAIMTSALLELNSYVDGNEMRKFAIQILTSLSTDYTNPAKDKSPFVLKHCLGNYPINSEIDVSINYADYYYIEALLRLKNGRF